MGEVATLVSPGGPIEIETATGIELTPASLIALEGIRRCADLLSGVGVDWGTGTGCLAVALSRVSAVERVVAIDINPAAVELTIANARRNAVGGRIDALTADLFEARDAGGHRVLRKLLGQTDFLVSNPPASRDGDGLGWRRRMLSAARGFLRTEAPALIQIAGHYGAERIAGLASAESGYAHLEVVTSSDWAPFDLNRADLREAMSLYMREERRGGSVYEFRLEGQARPASAAEALAVANRTGENPLTRWQVHRFARLPSPSA